MLHSDRCAKNIAEKCYVGQNSYRAINKIEAAELRQAQLDDCRALAQAAFATFAEAIHVVRYGRYTWATVKAYYSLFYSVRTVLSSRGESIFYIGSSPHLLVANGEEVISRKKGNTHSAVFDRFRTSCSSDMLLSQVIEYRDPISWLEELRNFASYRCAPIPDPDPPPHFKTFSQFPRKLSEQYLSEDVPIFAFLPDHAVVALPVLALRRVNEELEHLESNVAINSHFITLIQQADCNPQSFQQRLTRFALG